ncbi:MAG: urea carboxylase [Neisseriaceae bacterium]
MFQKVLIANRGACATRILKTLKKLQINSVVVYSEVDASSLHVKLADEAYSLGSGGATDTYLNMDKILKIACDCGAQAIHPGYGFLSENVEFVKRVEQLGLIFLGPTAQQIADFGLKHRARELALQAEVPLSPGSPLLQSVEQAKLEASRIGYPVMLKSTAGGGGIGMQLCSSEKELEAIFESIKALSANNFSNDGLYLEKYIKRGRHIEVQMIGDGLGKTLAIGERDCSSQRRNQKVIEECPAPNLTDTVRNQLYQIAERLLASVCYRSVGTVEFIYDVDSETFYFLEVNTRLQVEHGITEEVYGIDLVEWMLRLASDKHFSLETKRKVLRPKGHAIQARIYAEDPYHDFRPSAGLLTQVIFPRGKNVRVDTWVEAGVEVAAFFDPMLAKLIVHSVDREGALALLANSLKETKLYGVETNLRYLETLLAEKTFQEGKMTTRFLNSFISLPSPRMEFLRGGSLTTVQDAFGRSGYWDIGVPPSGAYDSYSFRLANRLLKNPENAAGLEITLEGPSIQFNFNTQIVLAGAQIEAKLDNKNIPNWQVIAVKAGQTLELGRVVGAGCRSYLAVTGGIECPDYLGSKATFALGRFGGHSGRAIRAGDILKVRNTEQYLAEVGASLPLEARPQLTDTWELKVIYGPHGAPDFFTEKDMEVFFHSEWEVHYNSNRTGIRLIGPKPSWSRTDGGEAGLHPSNIHDNAYAFGSVNFTGDVPIILGPDGPSLGGFVCCVTVITADLWKLGQLRVGDRVKFLPIAIETAILLEKEQTEAIGRLAPMNSVPQLPSLKDPILANLSAEQAGESVIYRAAGDHFLLVEYGELVMDVRLRLRVYRLMQWLEENSLAGLKELTPGVRSLQIHFDSQILSHKTLLNHLAQAELILSQPSESLTVPARIVYLPMSWDDEACRMAIEKYMQTIRREAPWCPSNLEFIRRINGLKDISEVKEIVFNATYLVAGLGDVYLGAPLAIPLDPRDRLLTTKYNPVRTWTVESSVGIGGAYLCIYGMDGPGGYQLIGRTVSMWNHYHLGGCFEKPWLLRFFDLIRFYEVSPAELSEIRKALLQGEAVLKIEPTQFSWKEYAKELRTNQEEIKKIRAQRENSFNEELARWHAEGQFNFTAVEEVKGEEIIIPEGSIALESPVSGSVWKIEVELGQTVKSEQRLISLESMKMEIPILAKEAGIVESIHLKQGQNVHAGQVMLVLKREQCPNG